MTTKVSFTEFVAWCLQLIDPARLSDLMTEYGFTDDSIDNVVDAIALDENFRNDFSALLSVGMAEKEEDIGRTVGGVNIADSSISAQKWLEIATSAEVTRATGSSDGFDWNALLSNVLSTAGGVVSSIWGKQQPAPQQQQVNTQASGSSIALYIIIGVVVLAVFTILIVSISKR